MTLSSGLNSLPLAAECKVVGDFKATFANIEVELARPLRVRESSLVSNLRGEVEERMLRPRSGTMRAVGAAVCRGELGPHATDRLVVVVDDQPTAWVHVVGQPPGRTSPSRRDANRNSKTTHQSSQRDRSRSILREVRPGTKKFAKSDQTATYRTWYYCRYFLRVNINFKINT